MLIAWEDTRRDRGWWVKTNSETSTTKIMGLSVRNGENVDPHQRRWVEFADYLTLIGNNGDRIPPKWHGWLSHTYDDIPTYGAR